MKKLEALLATVLISFCFLVNINYETQTILFCNDSGKENKYVITNTEEIEGIIDWQKDKKECVDECTYWRVLKLKPEGIICTEIKYNFGNITI